jgi:hypothetical protein
MTPNLSQAQLAVLKAAILADPVLAAFPNGGDGNFAIAQAMNLEAVPAVVVWKDKVTDQEVMQNGFDWTRVDNLSVGKARIWDWMFRFGYIDASKSNIRAGIDACWAGTAQDLAVRAAVYVHCKRNASRVEALFDVGTGTTLDPSTLPVSGVVTPSEIETARNLP